MLDEFRSTLITWDKATSRIYSPVTANASDENGRKLVVQIVNSGQVEDLTGATLHLYWETRGKAHFGLDVFKAVDLKNGEFELSYTTGMLSNQGVLNANLVLIDTVGRVVSERFKITVTEGIDDDAIQSENSFTTLTQALIDIGNLGQDYTPILNDITAQLQQTEQELSSQLAQTAQQVKEQTLTPLYIETLVSFSRFGIGVPSGVNNYAGGNYELTVSGVAGDDFFTVSSGKIADAGATTKWAAVLEKPGFTYEGYRVTGTDGINKVYVYPNVRESVSDAVLANLHDMAEGQHYTEKGYKAFGQHIFNNSGYHSQRGKYIARFLGNDTNGSWETIGNTKSVIYNRGLSPVDLSSGILRGDSDLSLTFLTDTAFDGLEWEVSIDKNVGYFEGFFGIHSGSSVTVEFYIDNILHETKVINKEVERVIFDFNFGDTAKVKIISDTDDETTVRVGNCYWWKTEKVPKNIFNTINNKAVYLGDSWGTYHNQANPREIERLWKTVNTEAVIVNRSQGGMTTKYARSWFDEYVINEKPDILILEYFTNDITSILTGNGVNFVDPAGQTKSTVVTKGEYFENIRYMIDKAIQNNIQPIIILPAAVTGQSQTQHHSIYSAKLANGGSVVPRKAVFNEVNALSVNADKVLTDIVETKTDVNTYLDFIVSYYGARVKPRVMLYEGSIFSIVNNNDKVLYDFKANELIGAVFPSLELDGFYAEQGLKLPNTQIVDNANVLKIKQRADKTLSGIEIGEDVEKVTMKAPLEMFKLTKLPTAEYVQRGRMVFIEGGTGTADKLYICIKNASQGYEWKEL